jgi:hypothetical protein
LNKIAPIGQLLLKDFSSEQIQTRLNYGIGFIWYSIPSGEHVFSRLQSFSDEPGTFALATIPALYYSIYLKKHIFTVVIASALFLTFSIGIILPVIVVFFLFCKNKQKIVRIVSLITIVLIGYMSMGDTPKTALSEYLKTKYSADKNDYTSSQKRNSAAIEAYSLVSSYPLGLGLGGETLVKEAIANFVVLIFVKGGIIGGICGFASFTLLLLWAIKITRKSDDELLKTIGYIYIVNYGAALTRGTIDITFFSFWIIAMQIFAIAKYKSNRRTNNLLSTQCFRLENSPV